MLRGTPPEMLFALLLCLTCLPPEIVLEQTTREVTLRFNSTLLLPGISYNISLVFNVEWRAQLNGRENNTISIVTYSPSSESSHIDKRYKQRVDFSLTNFSLRIYHVTFSDEGIYILTIQLNNSEKPPPMSTRVTVIIPVSSVWITSNLPALHPGNNITLNCSVGAGNALSYSWEKGDQRLPSGDRTILSKDNTSLTLLNVQQSDVGKYRCVVRNALSSDHKDFLLQLCAGAKPWLSYGLYGYPGYLGYSILLFYVVRWLRRTRKCSTKGQSGGEDTRLPGNPTTHSATGPRPRSPCLPGSAGKLPSGLTKKRRWSLARGSSAFPGS